MIVKIKKIGSEVCLDALDCIPLIRDGKADVNALTSFHQDIKMFRRFKQAYEYAEDKTEALSLIKRWNTFIDLRNIEDFIPHGDSKNKLTYLGLF